MTTASGAFEIRGSECSERDVFVHVQMCSCMFRCVRACLRVDACSCAVSYTHLRAHETSAHL
eukprot:15433647-Alexandrium_andersonii.AAC.1